MGKLLLIWLGAVTLATAVQAQTVEERFRRLDSNGDGLIAWAEAEPTRAAEFNQMDRNRDSYVTSDEFAGRAMSLGSYDADGDGRLTLSEYVGRHRAMFASFDEDRDGHISPSEFAAAQQAARGASK